MLKMANTRIEFPKETKSVQISLDSINTGKVSFLKGIPFVVKPGEKLTITVRGLLIEGDAYAYIDKPAGFNQDA